MEIWQADAAGRYHHPDDPRNGPPDASLTGFGRIHTDRGRVLRGRDHQARPGARFRRAAGPAPGGRPVRAGPGRYASSPASYFDDEPSNAGDPILALVPADRRPTLVAASRGDGAYRFDIALQGPHETVFFEV